MINDPFYQSWSNQTNLHPLGAAAMVSLGLLMLVAPRRYAMWPLIAMACFIAPAQRVVFVSLDFDLLRILVLFGWARLILRSEFHGLKWRLMDWIFTIWATWNLLSLTLLRGSLDGFVNALGQTFDAVGMYFLFRCLIRDWADLRQTVVGFVLASIPVAFCFLIESLTGRNLFAFLGGVPEQTMIRDGRLRCQGAFAHPIVAGCFWASLLPIVIAQRWQGGRGTLIALVGTVTSLVIIGACASSTPVAALIFGSVAAAFYVLRSSMWIVRWTLLVLILGLHMVMQSPVWHLISRIDIVGGSTGWHRVNLIDQAIAHAHEWWLVGSDLGTAHWGWGTADVTNYYLVQGLHGGVVQVLLFVALISVGFSRIGRARRAVEGDLAASVLTWSIGVALFIHVMNFIALSYFGQITMLWYMQLAIIAGPVSAAAVSVPTRLRRRRFVRRRAVVPARSGPLEEAVAI